MRLFHALIQGFGGAGKTTLAAHFANCGLRVIHIAVGAEGAEPFYAYCTPEIREQNVEFLRARDSFSLGTGEDAGLQVTSRAITQVERLLFSGNKTLGKPETWGPETMVVVDGLTELGFSAEERVLAVNDNTREGRHLWMAAQAQRSLAQLGRQLPCHFMLLAHLDIKAPKPESGYKDETQLQKDLKRERAEIEDTGYFPLAASVKISRHFVTHFPFALVVEAEERYVKPNNPGGNVLRTKPMKGYQIKCPMDLPDMLPLNQAAIGIIKGLRA